VGGVRRVVVVGNSGSGKTTVGRRLAAALEVPFVELDSIFHQRDWQPLPKEEFRARVGDMVAGDGWVVDGNYSAVRDLVWARADTIVWFDLPRHVVMRQVVARTLRRTTTGQELWNGNRERFRNLFRWAPDESIIRWAWTRHAVYRDRYRRAAADPALAHLTFVRIGGRADAETLVSSAGPSPRPGAAA
jgi:adenylate kinase family enzyme